MIRTQRWLGHLTCVLSPLAVAVAQVGAQAPSGAMPRLLEDLSVLAHDSMEGRRTGTPGNERARAFLVRSLMEAGASPVGDSYEHPFETSGGGGVNLIAMVPGTRTDRVIVVTAHYDHVGVRSGVVFNGADDNASGVAVALAIARYAGAQPLGATLVIALMDAEEIGLLGARAFIEAPPVPIDRIALNVNLDMVSRTSGLLWAAGTYYTRALRPVIRSATADAPVTVRFGHDRPGAPEGADWTNSSDHGPFHQAGIPFVVFGVDDHADYHRPTDDFENVDPREFLDAARTIMSALLALDEALPSLTR